VSLVCVLKGLFVDLVQLLLRDKLPQHLLMLESHRSVVLLLFLFNLTHVTNAVHLLNHFLEALLTDIAVDHLALGCRILNTSALFDRVVRFHIQV